MCSACINRIRHHVEPRNVDIHINIEYLYIYRHTFIFVCAHSYKTKACSIGAVYWLNMKPLQA